MNPRAAPPRPRTGPRPSHPAIEPAATAITARFAITRIDLLRLMWLHPDWTTRLVATLIFSRGIGRVLQALAVAALVGLGVTVAVADGPPPLPPLLAFAIGAASLVAPIAAMIAYAYARLRTQLAPRGHDAPHRIDADDASIRFDESGRVDDVPWATIELAYTLKRDFLFRTRFHGDRLVPRRVFDDDGEALFVAIHRHLPAAKIRTGARDADRAPSPWAAPLRRGALAVMVALMVYGAVVFVALWYAVVPR